MFEDATAREMLTTLAVVLGMVGLTCSIGYFAHACVTEQELTLRACLREHTVAECKLMEIQR